MSLSKQMHHQLLKMHSHALKNSKIIVFDPKKEYSKPS